MKKNNLGILILVLLLCIALIGCSQEQTENPTDGDFVAQAQYVQLDKSQIVLDKTNDYTLQCTAVGITEAVQWTSSDAQIATVENGKVVAHAVGDAEITASAGGYSAKCAVTVKDDGVVPAFDPYNGAFEIKKDHTYDVNPVILFAGEEKSLADAQLTYTVENSEIATIDSNGVASALKEGTTTFTVSGSFRGIKLVPITGVIEVKKNITIAFNAAEVLVYACDPDGTYQTQFQVESVVYVEGKLQKDAQLVWNSEDKNIATVENGLISGNRAGEVMINATYTTAQGDVVEAGVLVNVERPKILLEDLVEFDLSKPNGRSSLSLGELTPYVDGLFTGFYDITDGAHQKLSGASYTSKLSVPNKSFTEHGFRRYALESELVSV